MRRIYLIKLLVFLSVSIAAQNVEFKASNFKEKKEEFKAIMLEMQKGDEQLELGNAAVELVHDIKDYFNRALYYYNKAYAFNPNSADLNYKMGNAYLYTNEKYKAKEYLEKALKLDPAIDPMIYYYYAHALKLDQDFTTALANLRRFETEANSKRAIEMKKFLKKFREECRDAPPIIGTKQNVWVDNVKEVNSEFDDYSPCISVDGEVMVLTSKRPNSHQTNDVGIYDSDIYESKQEKGRWTSPTNVGPPLSTQSNEVVAALSYDGQRLLAFSYGDGASADVMESKLSGRKWSPLGLKMSEINNTLANETYACYEPQDIKVYYIYDGKLHGDKDIFFSGKIPFDPNQRWGKGQSVGSYINTAFNEGSVYIHPDGYTMYFSSEGHNSLGGYDIFKAELVNGVWQNPVNLGYPINTPYDDFFFAATANGKNAYISSNRAGGKGGLDLYKVTYWEEKPVIFDTENQLLASLDKPTKSIPIEQEVNVVKKSLTVFKGKVIDYLTKQPLEAEIDITDNKTGQIISVVTTNSATGKFLLSLPSGLNYGIAVKKPGYLFHSENFNLPEFSEFNMVNKDVELKNIKVGSKIALRNVFYETAKSNITPESYPELNRLVDLLKQVPNLKIEVSGHTDDVGSDVSNMTLSQARADEVKAYLVKNGITANRLVAKGYGETKPVATNDTPEGRHDNRRTEYEITGN